MADDSLNDSRFSYITKDPRFLKLPRREQKVKIDKRFHGMFKDERFKVKYTIDKRGRPMKNTSNDDLKKFYDLSDEAETSGSDGDNDDSNEDNEDSDKDNHESDEDDNDIDDNIEDEIDTRDDTKKKVTADKPHDEERKQVEGDSGKTRKNIDLSLGEGPDLARGEGNITTDTESDDDEDSDAPEDEIDHQWEELDQKVVSVTAATRRLAICGMDWDRIKATDLFFLFESFRPPSGLIHSVKIYPSEYGRQRMSEEAVRGPSELKVEPEGEANPDGEKYDVEKLRAYQMKRLQYYYAVVECDSPETANVLYEECDGREFEASCSRLDLRFIPDDMEFDEEATSVCTEPPDRDTYSSNLFITKALGQSKVDLTWDETDNSRYKLLTRKLTKDEVEDLDFKAYLASSSEASGEESDAGTSHNTKDEGYSDTEQGTATEEARILKYRELMKGIAEEESEKAQKEVSMEVTWEPGMMERTQEYVKKKKSPAETTWEMYLEGRKVKQRERRSSLAKNKQNEISEISDVREVAEPSITHGDPGGDGDGQVAFSDDELPHAGHSAITDDRASATNIKKSKKRKREKPLTEEEQKQIDREKDELSLLMGDDGEGEAGRAHYNLDDLVDAARTKKSKKRKKKDKRDEPSAPDDFKIELKDSRFNAIYSSHLFNIDPSAPEFRRTKAMDEIIREKVKRQAERQDATSGPANAALQTKNSIESLVKSVKSKTKHHHKKSTPRP